jgi:hypothetical protein
MKHVSHTLDHARFEFFRRSVVTEPDYQALLQRLQEQLDAMAMEVLALRPSEPNTDLRRLISVAGVPDDFIQHLAMTIRARERLAASIHDDLDLMVSQRERAAAFDTFERDLRVLADQIHAATTILRAESGRRALAAYAVVQSFLRQPGGMELGPSVRHLRALLGRGRPRKKAAAASDSEPGK